MLDTENVQIRILRSTPKGTALLLPLAQLYLPHPYFFENAEWLTALAVLGFVTTGYYGSAIIDRLLICIRPWGLVVLLLWAVAATFHLVAFRITDNVWFGGGLPYLAAWYLAAVMTAVGIGYFARRLEMLARRR